MLTIPLTSLLLACSGGADSADPADRLDLVMPDFSLEDLNPSSARFGEAVSPRDYLEQVSGWYFGHST